VRRQPPVFLARTGYRLRRVMDAARFLPVVGAFLFMLPLLWGGGPTGGGIVYVFVVWFGLIVSAVLLSRPLRRSMSGGSETTKEGQDSGSV
jgi:hypothetical protein